MDFKKAFYDGKILVPMLQRDYVQGATESVIVPFIDKLLESDCDLNYIYGYEEEDGFVPVDGQQRLITLWILHLYIYSRKKNPKERFNVSLEFQAREYATEFCARLREKLRDILSCADNISYLDEEIKDRNWYIASWSKNATVRNMLLTLRYLHRKVDDRNIDTLYDRFFTSESPVSFAFLRMTGENGLDDDIYIKMNGRGRPLSAFENLKSWMDKRVEDLPIASGWRGYMDNRWTNLFWQNRNLTQEHPEEIDDEQLHLFCNLLILFHVKNDSLLLNTLSESNFKEELIEYLEIGSDDVSDDKICNKILNNLTKGIMLPLVWLERLDMMPDEFFCFAFNSLNTLSDRFNVINDSGLYFGGADLDHEKRVMITRIYELSMTGSSFGRTLPLLYAALAFKDGSASNLYDWLRVMRNLILNRESKDGEKYVNLKNVIAGVDKLSDIAYTRDIFEYLSTMNDEGIVSDILGVFSNRQIREEIRKALPENRKYRDDFIRLENQRFFSGRIDPLFSFLPEGKMPSIEVWSVVEILCIIFGGGDNGVTSRFDDGKHYLRRALMLYEPYWFGFERNRYWSFCNGLDEWRRYVRGKNPDALISLVREFAPFEMSADALYAALKERVEGVSGNYQADISAKKEDTFRYHFIHHPGVWDYMNTKLAIWCDNPYDIILKKTDSNNSRRMELRTYCLYLDYCHIKELKAQYQDYGWKIGIWERGDTCFYLQREKMMTDGSIHIIAIDVLFRGTDGKRSSEDCYAYSVFVRTSDDDDDIEINSRLLLPSCRGVFERLRIMQNPDSGRFVNSGNLSRSDVMKHLKELLSVL